ncbi:FGGY-family carbohydrate kinase [Chitinophaga japonensis]|uniref:Sugar (Pentulose or hexulose) kinase n=1 Tax=Chitinophaga japonensis TaxID=104662 RepID=A0A562TBP3_CHIJA|nr:FGGY-family carbohydrate kinase [Chitinophaga japonensis]TWI90952.1 sugar (pentulose or hexulose) kinase [Chitinophaga japonensis]
MHDDHACFIGIDVGTQGARVVLADARGQLLGSREESFPLSAQSREEQSPPDWWAACLRSLQQLLKDVARHTDLRHIRAMAVTSTSGTIIPIDHDHQPLHPAIMYSDGRQVEEGRICREAALAYNPEGYTAFNTSSGLPKMLWFINRHPGQAGRLYKFIHAADFITGRLSGRYDVTDLTNALKSGYDVQRKCWPAYIWQQLPLQQQWLQQVVPSGTPVGALDPALAASLGLPDDVMVVAGMTDGCASQIASGAVKPGDWNTTIGTTLVVKGVTTAFIHDPSGSLYCHRHPEGYWMPGGASNTGADWISRQFSGNLAALETAAAALIPSGHLSWPLLQEGERFPFVAPQARGFEAPGLSTAERLAAGMEGVACIERYAYARIRQLSGEAVKAVYTAGGASNSDAWLRIRSNVLNLPLYKMKHVTGAMGAAILAASKTCFSSIMEAAAAMTQVEKEVRPEPALATDYEAHYQEFIQTLQQKGYIPHHTYA